MRPLGRTGMMVSAVGLGTVALGRIEGLKLAVQPTRLPSDAEAGALLSAAQAHGVNLIDTAPAYGSSESRLGQLLPGAGASGGRPWVVCTKVGEEFTPEGSRFDFSAGAIGASIDQSLARLGVARLDVVLLHFSSAVDDAAVLERGEAVAALVAARDAGKVRAIGASVSTVRGGRAAIAIRERGAQTCDVLMVALNLADRAMLPVVEDAERAGVGIVVKKALSGGRLGTESLKWVIEQRGVASAIVGTMNPAHLREACEAAMLMRGSGS